MTSVMIKTSVTIARDDLALAHHLGINVSDVARTALSQRLREHVMEQEVGAYAAAFAEWDEQPWNHLAADALGADEGR